MFVKAETENLSNGGVYCMSEEPFCPGDRLECEFFAPGTGSVFPQLVFRRHAIVVRLEVRGLQPGFRIACTFEERAIAAQAIGASAS